MMVRLGPRIIKLTDRIHINRAQQAALEQQNLGEDEELDLLQQLVEQERKRQGIPAPTDG